MTPITREEIYLAKLAGESVTVPSPVSRKEMYLAKACGESVTVPDPVSREEMYLYKLAGGSITLPVPVSRLELLMAAACGEAVTPYDPVSRIEWFWSQIISPVQTITGVPPLTFTSDGTDLSSWIIYGNGQQTGTPTPDAPIMPTFCGVRTGNLWDEEYLGGYYNSSNTFIPANNQLCSKSKIAVKPNTTYWLGVYSHSTSAFLGVLTYNENAEFIERVNTETYAGNGVFITTNASTYYININFGAYYGSTYNNDIMIAESSTPIPYEPYGWAEKITCAGQTTPVYLGQVQTVRRVKKLVLDGTETVTEESANVYSISLSDTVITGVGISTHFEYDAAVADGQFMIDTGKVVFGYDDTQANFAAFLAAQYDAGTPVTVWYVLETPTTGIVNEPLCKIGDYADELHSTAAGVTIQTVSGSNTLTIGTDLQPSSVSITGHISQ